MGGIAIDLESADTSYSQFFDGTKRLTLTGKGVSLLAQCGHLPDISLEYIKDKNKADSLAKLLACFQAGWTIIQVIVRQSLDMPSTLLEVHTVAHVVCALLVYAVWWHKPRQVSCPTILRGESVIPLAAYMYSASQMSGPQPTGAFKKLLHPKPELKRMVYLDGQDDVSSQPRLTNAGEDPHGILDAPTLDRFVPLPASSTDERDVAVPEDYNASMRYRLAAKAVAMYPALRSRFQKPEGATKALLDPFPDKEYLVPYATEFAQPTSGNWPNAGLLRRTQSLIMGMTLWGTSMAYGAIHVSAWNYFFPTYAEHLLWRLSSVWVTFCAAFWLVVHLLAYFFPFVDRVWVAYNERRLGWAGTGVITLLCILCGVSFIASRAYLVVEAFVSVRIVPEGVYNTPSWAEVFPHL